MNILNAIGSGLRNVGQGIGTGALAAGKGLADYLNAQAMRQSGLTPEQLQQNPGLAKASLGNWLGSIGQGMQTGDYTGSRLGYQQEMLTKLQNLQAMKQQEAAKQRQLAYRDAMAQADTLEKQIAVARQYPEFDSSQIVNYNKVPSEISLQDAQRQHLLAEAKRLNQTQGKEVHNVVGIGDYMYTIFKDGSREVFLDANGVPVQNTAGRFEPTGVGLWDNKAQKFVKPDDSMEDSTIDQWNRAWKQSYIQAGGKKETFDNELALKPGATFSGAEAQQKAVTNAIGTLNGRFEASQNASRPGNRRATGPMMDKLEGDYSLFRSMADVVSAFKPEYVGNKFSGGSETEIQKRINDFGTPDQAAWYAAYMNMVNKARKGDFGATLTPEEKKAFDATVFDASMTPEYARSVLKRQMTVYANAVARRYQSTAASTDFPDQVNVYNPSQIYQGLDRAGWITPAPTQFPSFSVGNGAGGQSTPQASYKQTATGPDGHKIGSNDGVHWFDLSTGKEVQ